MSVDGAAYPLELVRQLLQRSKWLVTAAALNGALDVGLDEEDIFDCIVNHLSETHFYKTMPAEKNPALMQDVYRVAYQGERIYLKLQVHRDWAIVVSFKEE